MDGYKAARHIRKRNKKIKIIALSAGLIISSFMTNLDSGKIIKMRCKKKGFNALIEKPITKDILLKYL